jgi:hypothetical protein
LLNLAFLVAVSFAILQPRLLGCLIAAREWEQSARRGVFALGGICSSSLFVVTHFNLSLLAVVVFEAARVSPTRRMPPNAKLTDDEERANGIEIATCD